MERLERFEPPGLGRKEGSKTAMRFSMHQLLKMQNDEEWDCFYETQAAFLEAKPYPTLAAIQNVFALALKRDPDIKNFNPLALWDLHYLREIDDSGYINRLYA